MSDLFHDVGSIDYPILDADAHVNEPPNLWQDGVPARWRERAPRVVRGERGDIWEFDGGREKWPVGLTAAAGQSVFQMAPTGQTYEKMRPGSFDPAARLRDLDADGIWAQVLYPSVTLKGARIYSGERELQLACVRAYNEWIAAFCAGSGGRLVPQAIIPTTGVEDAISELEWSLKNGLKGAVVSSFPNGSLYPKQGDEPFWARAEEAGVPLAVHIGSFVRTRPPGTGGSAAPPAAKSSGSEAAKPSASSTAKPSGSSDVDSAWAPSLAFVARAAWTKAGGQTLDVVCDLLFSGLFDPFPRLKIVLVESNIGWIPTLLEQSDDMFRRYRWWTGAHEKMSELPSTIFHRNFWATFMVDRAGLELRHRLNLDHVMWSTDYPHSGTDWPSSMVSLENLFRGIPRSEVKRMLHDNTKALYDLDVPEKARGR
jgi:predicted TIM-barrel fold metal-dependent hydrolase